MFDTLIWNALTVDHAVAPNVTSYLMAATASSHCGDAEAVHRLIPEFKIFNLADLVVLELPDTMEDAYTFKALQDGMYTVCFRSIEQTSINEAICCKQIR